jgi:hypothetical protein
MKTDVPLSVAATLTWTEGRRAYFECGFNRAGVQYLEVGHERGT